MINASSLQLALDDLIADLRHSRRTDDLGRLALLAYCEVRRWARSAGESELAKLSSEMMTDSPHNSRESFLAFIDQLIAELVRVQRSMETAEQGRSGGAAPWTRSQSLMHG